MTRQASCVAVLLAGLMLFVGCSSVMSKHPIGRPLTAEQLDLVQTLEGVWVNDEGTFFVKPLADGELALATAGWDKSEGKFAVTELRGRVGMVGDRAILNIVEPDEDTPDDEKEYLFLAITGSSDEVVVLYVPDASVFAAAVEADDLAGTVERGEHSTTVHLTGDPAAIEAFLTPERFPAAFETASPQVYRRVGKLQQ